MVRYTSILLPLAHSRKKRLEEAAAARGETLESFILEAAEAEAKRIGRWLSDKGHSVDHPIYASTPPTPRLASGTRELDGEQQIAAQRVALELGWSDGDSDEWRHEVDRLIASLETIDELATRPAQQVLTSKEERRSPRRFISTVQVLNPVHGTVLDMSETGIGIETEGPFSVPEQIQLSIGQSVACAKVRAEVRWCVLVRTESYASGDVVPIYRSGLAFLGH